jgi:hypothetical protein
MQLASATLARAAADYRWLLDRGYPPKAALKLVGDRRRMTGDERMILFRGVASSAASASRAAVIEASAAGRAVYVDGYNQALTVMHYLAGRPVFVSSDGLLRDAGGSHGRIANQALFERAASALVDHLASLEPVLVAVFLDSPVSGSAGHAAMLRALFAAQGIEARLSLEKSADAPLKAAPRGCLVASSDSAIADAIAEAAARSGYGSTPLNETARLYDAARWTIARAFGQPDLLDLGRLLAQ